MANITANSLNGFLAVYAQKSLNAFLANMPDRNLFTENFDDSIAAGGVSLTTRIPTTVYGALNDLGTNGWESQSATASAVTFNLSTKGHDHPFNVTEWATITPSMLENLYLPVLAKQTANGVVASMISNVTSSVYTSTVTVSSSSLLSVTGSSSLQTISSQLTKNEIPQDDRYAIVSPDAFVGLTNNILFTYQYGSSNLVQFNGYGDNASVGQRGTPILNFSVFQYPRFYGAALPYGGDKYAGGDKLIGIAGHKQGLIAGMRAPMDMNTGLIQSYTAVDPTSKVSLQVIVAFDQSKPAWRVGTYVLFGSAAGNTKAIVPILTQSV